VLPAVLPRVLLVAGYSWGIAYLGVRRWVPTFPPTVHAVLGTVLGLMLAFRTNASYDRWWEGRRAWGSITNRCRDIVRQTWMTRLSPADQKRIADVLVAFAHSAKRQMFRESVQPELQRLLAADEVDGLMHAPGPALRLLSTLSQELSELNERGVVKDTVMHRMDVCISELLDSFGACQRIQRTPIPIAYVIHLRRFLILYCFSVPFALVEFMGYYTPIAVTLIAYSMFGIEEIGVQIEEPFIPSPNDVDLDRITHRIERDLYALIGELDAAPLDSIAPPAAKPMIA
jgi:ion channel-forming bestrophin family protein